MAVQTQLQDPRADKAPGRSGTRRGVRLVPASGILKKGGRPLAWAPPRPAPLRGRGLMPRPCSAKHSSRRWPVRRRHSQARPARRPSIPARRYRDHERHDHDAARFRCDKPAPRVTGDSVAKPNPTAAGRLWLRRHVGGQAAAGRAPDRTVVSVSTAHVTHMALATRCRCDFVVVRTHARRTNRPARAGISQIRAAARPKAHLTRSRQVGCTTAESPISAGRQWSGRPNCSFPRCPPFELMPPNQGGVRIAIARAARGSRFLRREDGAHDVLVELLP
jgi:hypothetical protein